jgi:hypothetical protein
MLYFAKPLFQDGSGYAPAAATEQKTTRAAATHAVMGMAYS